MNRLVEDLGDGCYRITESTGEVHQSTPERPTGDGFRLWQYITVPILTEAEIETTALPHFYVENYSVYPEENETILPHLIHSHNLLGRSICERVARIRIAKNLNIISESENI